MTHAGNFSGKKYLGMSGITVSIIFVIAASVALAQLPTATILGTVKDASGAVVPGVALTARNVETGQTRTAVTAGDGSYRFSALPVGSYEVRAEHSGFRTEVRSGLTLTVTQEAAVNFILEVGGVEQTVNVSAEAPLVNTTSGSLGGLVNEDKISDLPLNGRNFIDLTLLQTGISHSANMGVGAVASGTIFSSNGAPIFSNNYLLDGASMVTFFGTSPASSTGSTLGVDGIREYRVVTNSFSAEYGMTMGSQMLIVTKSGTNTFHGSLFEYLRNSVLDARNFFDYKTATNPSRLPPFKRNNFGGSFGGPIKKDKTFFFGVYEGLRQRLGLTTNITTIPASAKVDGGVGGVAQIAPVIKPFLPYFPEPNLPNNQFTFPFSQANTDNYGQMRVDQTISGADTMFARYTIDDGQALNSTSYPAFPWSWVSRNQYLTLSENHVFSATLLNTFRASFSRTLIDQEPTTAGLGGPQFSFVQGLPVGGLTIGGLTSGWGPRGTTPQRNKQNIFTWSDDMFYSRGRHALKFGVLINRYQQYVLSSSNARGSITFANLNSFLLGQPSSYLAVTPGSILDRAYHYTTLGFYAQDDLRVNSRLTLNLGLRYEFNTTYHETHNQHAALRDIRNDATTTVGIPFLNPSLRNFGPRLGFAWDVMGNGKTAIRGGFGLLYDIGDLGGVLNIGVCAPPFCNSSTVSIPATSPVTLTLPLTFPASAAGKSIKDIDYHLQQPHMLQYNLTVERQLPWAMALTLAYGGSRGLNLMQFNDGNPTVPQVLADGRKFWTGNEARINPNFATMELHTAGGDSWYNSLQFGLLKRVTKGLQFQSSYTWGKVLDTSVAQVGGEPMSSQQFPSDPSDRRRERGVSGYDLNQNWKFNAIYRMPDVANSGSVMGKFLNGWGASGIVSMQTGFPADTVIQTNRSRSQVNGAGTNIDRPDVAPGYDISKITSGTTAGCPGVAAGRKLGTPNLWFDPCAFTLQLAGFLGSAGRNILRGPGLTNVNFSLTKDTPLHVLGEGGKVEFRCEIFNIFNHPNFGTPLLGGSTANGSNSAGIIFAGRADGEARQPLAGVISNTSSMARQIQFALKIVF